MQVFEQSQNGEEVAHLSSAKHWLCYCGCFAAWPIPVTSSAVVSLSHTPCFPALQLHETAMGKDMLMELNTTTSQ